MTAELAILNTQAVALAADSAVTVGSGKIYNSANKLFTLSKYQPVGVMIYHSANVMGLPLETVIKVFRERIGEGSYDTLEQYVEAFVQSLRDPSNYLFDDESIDRYMNSYYGVIATDLAKKLNEHVRSGVVDAFVQEKKPNINTIVREYLDEKIKTLKAKENASEIECEDLEGDYEGQKDYVEQALEREFGYKLTRRSGEKFNELVILYAVKEWHLYSGMVFAGFGTRDAYPKLRSFEIDLICKAEAGGQRKLKYRYQESHLSPGAGIYPFAQWRMVDRFLRGIDYDYRSFLHGHIGGLLENYNKHILEILELGGGEEEKELAEVAKAQIDALKAEMESYERQVFINPILNNLINLPKDELAAMAEALVSITSLKKRISTDEESVGGPVDVAVISKGDGFIWIQRKHYFEPEFNHHFFENYFNGQAHLGTAPTPTK